MYSVILFYLGKFKKPQQYGYNSLLEAVSLSIENLNDHQKKLYKQLAVFLDDVGIPPKVVMFYCTGLPKTKCTY